MPVPSAATVSALLVETLNTPETASGAMVELNPVIAVLPGVDVNEPDTAKTGLPINVTPETGIGAVFAIVAEIAPPVTATLPIVAANTPDTASGAILESNPVMAVLPGCALNTPDTARTALVILVFVESVPAS